MGKLGGIFRSQVEVNSIIGVTDGLYIKFNPAYVKKFFFITQYFTRLTRQFHWKYTNNSDDGAINRYKKYLKFTKVDEHGSNIDPMIRYV